MCHICIFYLFWHDELVEMESAMVKSCMLHPMCIVSMLLTTYSNNIFIDISPYANVHNPCCLRQQLGGSQMGNLGMVTTAFFFFFYRFFRDLNLNKTLNLHLSINYHNHLKIMALHHNIHLN